MTAKQGQKKIAGWKPQHLTEVQQLKKTRGDDVIEFAEAL